MTPGQGTRGVGGGRAVWGRRTRVLPAAADACVGEQHLQKGLVPSGDAVGSGRRARRLRERRLWRGPPGGSTTPREAAGPLCPPWPRGCAAAPRPAQRGKGPLLRTNGGGGRIGAECSPPAKGTRPSRQGLIPGGLSSGGRRRADRGASAAPGLNQAQERGGDQSAH